MSIHKESLTSSEHSEKGRNRARQAVTKRSSTMRRTPASVPTWREHHHATWALCLQWAKDKSNRSTETQLGWQHTLQTVTKQAANVHTMLRGTPSDTVHLHDHVGCQSNTDISTRLSPDKEDGSAHQEDSPGEPSPQATPATKRGHMVLSYHEDNSTSPHHDSTTGRPNTTILSCINRTPIEWFSKKQRSTVTDLTSTKSNTNALMPIIERDVTAHEPTVHNNRVINQAVQTTAQQSSLKLVTCGRDCTQKSITNGRVTEPSPSAKKRR